VNSRLVGIFWTTPLKRPERPRGFRTAKSSCGDMDQDEACMSGVGPPKDKGGENKINAQTNNTGKIMELARGENEGGKRLQCSRKRWAVDEPEHVVRRKSLGCGHFLERKSPDRSATPRITTSWKRRGSGRNWEWA